MKNKHVYCLLEEEIVESRTTCTGCEYWTGKKCDILSAIAKNEKKLSRKVQKLLRSMRLKKQGGRRYKIPKEPWSFYDSQGETGKESIHGDKESAGEWPEDMNEVPLESAEDIDMPRMDETDIQGELEKFYEIVKDQSINGEFPIQHVENPGTMQEVLSDLEPMIQQEIMPIPQGEDFLDPVAEIHMDNPFPVFPSDTPIDGFPELPWPEGPEVGF